MWPSCGQKGQFVSRALITLHFSESASFLSNKEITLSLRWPHDAPSMWVPWKL